MKAAKKIMVNKKDKDIARQLNIIEAFDSSEPDFSHRVTFEFAREFIKDKLVLNVGCWTGCFEQTLVDAGTRLVGLDINLAALKVAKRVNPRFDYVEGTVQHLPFKDETFETAAFLAVIEHLPKNQEAAALREINRVLKKGGHLILTTPLHHWQGNILDVAYWLTGHRHYKISDLKNILAECGFTIKKLEVRGGLISNLSIAPFYLGKYIFRKNIYKSRLLSRFFERDYSREGNKDIFLVVEKI